jgi:hypothetical protein
MNSFSCICCILDISQSRATDVRVHHSGRVCMHACASYMTYSFVKPEFALSHLRTLCVSFQVRLSVRDVEGISQMNLYRAFFTCMWY